MDEVVRGNVKVLHALRSVVAVVDQVHLGQLNAADFVLSFTNVVKLSLFWLLETFVKALEQLPPIALGPNVGEAQASGQRAKHPIDQSINTYSNHDLLEFRVLCERSQ